MTNDTSPTCAPPTPTPTPATPTRTPSTPALAYHRLARGDGRHRWWRPLVVGLLAIGLYVAGLLAVAVPVIVLTLAVPSTEPYVEQLLGGEMDFSHPLTLAVGLLSVALLLPAVLGADRLVGSPPVGLLSSVTGRLRRRWLATTATLAFAVWVPTMALCVAVEAATGSLEIRSVAPTTMLLLIVTTLALVPFQAAAEEYVFRGYLAQLVGAWLRRPVFAVLLPVPLFVVAHGYGTFGSIDVAAFAVVTGWLAWRTGGLEASIALHVANNVVLMTFTAVGLGDPGATDTDAFGLAVSLAMMFAYAALVTRRATALGIARTRPVGSLDRRPAPTSWESAGTPTPVEAGRA